MRSEASDDFRPARICSDQGDSTSSLLGEQRMSTDVVEIEGQSVGQSLRHGDERVFLSARDLLPNVRNMSSRNCDPNNIYNLVLNIF